MRVCLQMKTLKISDKAQAKLTSVVGRLIAETGKMKTYSDAIEKLLSRSVIWSPELLDQVGSFIKTIHNWTVLPRKSSYKMQSDQCWPQSTRKSLIKVRAGHRKCRALLFRTGFLGCVQALLRR